MVSPAAVSTTSGPSNSQSQLELMGQLSPMRSSVPLTNQLSASVEETSSVVPIPTNISPSDGNSNGYATSMPGNQMPHQSGPAAMAPPSGSMQYNSALTTVNECQQGNNSALPPAPPQPIQSSMALMAPTSGYSTYTNCPPPSVQVNIQPNSSSQPTTLITLVQIPHASAGHSWGVPDQTGNVHTVGGTNSASGASQPTFQPQSGMNYGGNFANQSEFQPASSTGVVSHPNIDSTAPLGGDVTPVVVKGKGKGRGKRKNSEEVTPGSSGETPSSGEKKVRKKRKKSDTQCDPQLNDHSISTTTPSFEMLSGSFPHPQMSFAERPGDSQESFGDADGPKSLPGWSGEFEFANPAVNENLSSVVEETKPKKTRKPRVKKEKLPASDEHVVTSTVVDAIGGVNRETSSEQPEFDSSIRLCPTAPEFPDSLECSVPVKVEQPIPPSIEPECVSSSCGIDSYLDEAFGVNKSEASSSEKSVKTPKSSQKDKKPKKVMR